MTQHSERAAATAEKNVDKSESVNHLREALRKYGRHLTGCAAVKELLADEEVACDCGFGWWEARL
jgi:hypothetical protein